MEAGERKGSCLQSCQDSGHLSFTVNVCSASRVLCAALTRKFSDDDNAGDLFFCSLHSKTSDQ